MVYLTMLRLMFTLLAKQNEKQFVTYKQKHVSANRRILDLQSNPGVECFVMRQSSQRHETHSLIAVLFK